MDRRLGEKDWESRGAYDGFIALIDTRGRYGVLGYPTAVSCLYS
jgi:hypothetical protein